MSTTPTVTLFIARQLGKETLERIDEVKDRPASLKLAILSLQVSTLWHKVCRLEIIDTEGQIKNAEAVNKKVVTLLERAFHLVIVDLPKVTGQVILDEDGSKLAKEAEMHLERSKLFRDLEATLAKLDWLLEWHGELPDAFLD